MASSVFYPNPTADASAPREPIKVVLGTMEMGRRDLDQAASEQMINTFLTTFNGEQNELDTAKMYCGGKTEQILGSMPQEMKDKVAISTKANPWGTNDLSGAGVAKQAAICFERLQTEQVDIFYLHAPDYKNSMFGTLEAVDKLYKAGKFKRFGVSNYSAWQVAEICYICHANGFVKPTVYQGMYNMVTRQVEGELFPCLRRFGLQFYAYNPLAGGILTGRWKWSDMEKKEEQKSSRFFNQAWADGYVARFWKKELFDGVDLIQAALEKTALPGESPLPLAEVAIQWMHHHSKLGNGDAIIIGASSMRHLAQNLAACRKPALHPDVLAAIDQAWDMARGNVALYYR